MIIEQNSYSVFSLNYHLILLIQCRKKVIDDKISLRAKEIFEYISPNYNIYLNEWNHDKDHIHIIFRAHPNSAISKFINAYKSASSRLIKKEYPSIKTVLWNNKFWSKGFLLVSVGNFSNEVLTQYIENQHKHS